MSSLSYDNKEGYIFTSDSGTRYGLLEGKSLKGEATSDIVFITKLDTGGSDIFVDYFWGAGDFGTDYFPESKAFMIIDAIINKYESKSTI